jgi:general secretion pathway protein F
MPVYEYVVLDQKGREKKGILDAEGQSAAKQRLRAKGYFPIEIKEARQQKRAAARGLGFLGRFFGGVSKAELNSATRLLSTLLSAGLPLDRALQTIIGQIQNPHFKKILAQVKDSVTEGNSLAFALSQHPRVFSGLYVNMVRSAEASGTLELVLERLAEFGENQQMLMNKIRAAMAYPLFMTVIGSLVLVFLISFVVPNIIKIFHQMRQALPLPTILLISISRFMGNYWWSLVLFVVAAIAVVIIFKEKPKVKEFLDLLRLRLPLVGPIYTKLTVSRFCRTLGNLLMAGIPIITGLQIAKNIVQNVHIGRIVDSAIDEVEKGRALAEGISRAGLFPGIVVQMIAVGEQSGQLEKMLVKAAETYEKEIEANITALTSILEPVLILVMGVVVGFIVISILLPIFEMNQLVR